ncbi:hypothetical protein [Natronospora cellulosivora (SeqCode)]
MLKENKENKENSSENEITSFEASCIKKLLLLVAAILTGIMLIASSVETLVLAGLVISVIAWIGFLVTISNTISALNQKSSTYKG